MRQPLRQLFSRTLHVHEGTVFHERYVPVVHIELVPRHRLSHVRHLGHPRPDHGYGVDSGEDVPADHALRLPDPPDGNRSPAHGAMRAPDKPLQREDIHLLVVLDGVRRDGDMLEFPTLDLRARLPIQSGALHPQTSPHHEQTESRRRQRRETVVQVRRDVPASRRRVCSKARRQELDGSRRRRHRVGALGQLSQQADEPAPRH